MGNVRKIVIEHFQRAYGLPRHIQENPQWLPGFFEDYQRALGGFSDDVLARAVRYVMDEQKYPTWPTVGAVATECKRLVPTQPSTPDHFRPEDEIEPSPEERERVGEGFTRLKAVLDEIAPDRRRPKFPDVSRPTFLRMQRGLK